MYFFVGLSKIQKKFDAIWVVIDRLTKFAHFIPIGYTYNSERLAWMYIREVMRLHGISSSIVSNRDPLFTSRIWKQLNSEL